LEWIILKAGEEYVEKLREELREKDRAGRHGTLSIWVCSMLSAFCVLVGTYRPFYISGLVAKRNATLVEWLEAWKYRDIPTLLGVHSLQLAEKEVQGISQFFDTYTKINQPGCWSPAMN
jgi:hypothetical protein